MKPKLKAWHCGVILICAFFGAQALVHDEPEEPQREVMHAPSATEFTCPIAGGCTHL